MELLFIYAETSWEGTESLVAQETQIAKHRRTHILHAQVCSSIPSPFRHNTPRMGYKSVLW